ncbi:hypothetical protein DFH09DRAFT_1098865 [Mycena vulgaris]|nr:hypothetical protein DFH09DRAFT_1098865 [Mycena vulgaris]
MSKTRSLIDFQQSPPPDPSIPSMLSKFIDVEYSSKISKQAYPPGEFFPVPLMPNIEDVNKLGGFNITHDRLAIIDGEFDRIQEGYTIQTLQAQQQQGSSLNRIVPNNAPGFKPVRTNLVRTMSVSPTELASGCGLRFELWFKPMWFE